MRFVLQCTLVVVSLVYLVFIFYLITTGDEPFPFAGYLPIYCFLFGQVPATVVLAVLYLRKYLEPKIGKELLLYIVSIGLLGLYTLILAIVEGFLAFD